MGSYVSYRRSSGSGLFIFAAVLFVIVISLVPSVLNALHIEERQITVCAKERVAVDGGGEYRIYAAEGTFVVGDSILGGVRFDSADFYAQIETPATYKVRAKGYRFGPLSWFPNILEAEEIPGFDARSACETAGLHVDDK